MHVCKEKVESDVKELEIPSFSEVGECNEPLRFARRSFTRRRGALTGVSYALACIHRMQRHPCQMPGGHFDGI